MCIIEISGEALLIGVSSMAPVTPATSASSAGLLQIMKPKLPRKITRTPRINLNKYWNLFENLMAGDNVEASSMVRREEFGDNDMNNEINENLCNEQREMDDILVRRNNERNSIASRSCTCHFCLISDLRNVTVSENSEEVTEL